MRQPQVPKGKRGHGAFPAGRLAKPVKENAAMSHRGIFVFSPIRLVVF